MPFVGQAEGKGRFRTLPVCAVKSRKFESFRSGNATKRPRGCIIFQHLVCYHCFLMVNTYADLYNHSAWAGLRCLSLERGNARARLQE
jgi:hypothetical protein